MQRLKLIVIINAISSMLLLTGCFPGVYKIDIQQGNIITQDMVNQLRPGMTKAQVKYLLGSPMVTDPFNMDRWDYIYSIQPGGGRLYQENVVLVFDHNEQLAGLAGDFLPGKTRDEEILDGTSAQPLDVQGSGSLEERIQQEVDAAKPVDVPTLEPVE